MGKQKDILKIWPDFLLFACLEGKEDMDKKLLFAKTGKTFSLDHPKQALTDFILYYSKAIQTPSPFLPLWGDCFLNKTVAAFEKAVEHQLKREKDPYLYFAFSRYDASTIFNHWAPYLRRVFSPLLQTVVLP